MSPINFLCYMTWFVSLYIAFGSGDLAFDWIKEKNNILGASPKLWHLYIRSFLSKVLKYQFYLQNYTSNQQWSLLLETCSNQFKTYDSTWKYFNTYISVFQSQGWHRYPVGGFARAASVHLRNATGQLFVNGSLQASQIVNKMTSVGACPFYDYQKGYFLNACHLENSNSMPLSLLHWKFFLDKLFSLNLTFHSLEFISGSVNFAGGFLHCHLGRLSIIDSEHQEFEAFQFCGQHAGFSLLPEFGQLDVRTTVYPITVFQVNATFCLMDKGLIYNLNHHKPATLEIISSTIDKSATLVKQFWSISPAQISLVYVIEVTKIYTLTLDLSVINFSNIRVLDGPGFLSSRAQKRKNLFESSSFSCILQAMSAGLDFQTQAAHYSANPQPVTKYESPENNSVHFPAPHICGNAVCLLQIRTVFKFQINVSVVKVIYKGQPSETCKYGGITTATLENGLYKENQIICKNHNHQGETSPNRNFYSLNSSLFVVVYWFEAYSHVDVSVIMQRTMCKPVHICTCTLRDLCRSPSIFRFYPKCMAYLQEMSKYSLMNMKLNRGCGAQWLGLYFAGLKNSCVVLQFARNRSCSPTIFPSERKVDTLGDLRVEHTPLYSPEAMGQLQFEAKGSFSQTSNEKEWKTGCRFICRVRNWFLINYRFMPVPSPNVKYVHLTETDLTKDKVIGQKVLFNEKWTLWFYDLLNAQTWLDVRLAAVSKEWEQLSFTSSDITRVGTSTVQG